MGDYVMGMGPSDEAPAPPEGASVGYPHPLYRVGVVLQGGPYLWAVDGLRKGLTDLGLEEGTQVVFYVREAKGDLKVAKAAVGQLEREKVDVTYSISRA